MTIYDASVALSEGKACRSSCSQVRIRLGKLARLGGERPELMGVRAAIAESFERIHRSNLVMMGIIPLEFMPARR